ncbi:MAG: DUF3047 domain-containing protein [Thiohalocapsa sp.]|nr:DUF3047 domain-containing protein [Thiohalocapsa sp.]
MRVSIWLLIAVLLLPAAASSEVTVGAFSQAPADGSVPAGWRLAKLPGVAPTRFRLGEGGAVTAVRLDADNAAASLFRPLRVDAARTPVLRWRWRVDRLIDGADIRQKDGDDLPARLYVMFDYPLERLPLAERTKIKLARAVAGDLLPAAALCYVWDGRLPAGTTLWNAYTDRVRVVVVRSGPQRIGDWVTEERDVAADFRAAFGEAPPPISGVAIAADTDQTGAVARSWFGDIAFLPHPESGAGQSQGGQP